MSGEARPHGREDHLAQITVNLRKASADRQSRVLLVKAAPGGGKTRLLTEAANIARGMGFALVDATVSTSVPMTAGLSAGSPDVVEATWARLRDVPEHRPVLVTLDDMHLSSPSALTGLCDLILAVRNRSILWLPSFSSEPGGPPSEPVRTCLSKLRGRVAVEPGRRLGPLSGDALKQLVVDYTGAPPDPALLALVESVNVTPSVVIELVRGLLEDGDISVADGRSQLVPVDPAGTGIGLPPQVPRRVSLLIENSLRWLSEPTVRTLRLAAVLGSPFAPEELAAMLDVSPVSLLSAVDEAVDRGFLVCGEDNLAFRTEPIWRVLLDSVPPPVRSLLRRQAAGLMLSRPDGVERAALQLTHVARPGNSEELEVIAEGARRMVVGDPSTAASLATRCMRLLEPEQATRVRLASTAVEALTRAGDLDEAVTVARSAIEEATNPAGPVDAGDIAVLRASMSAALLLQGDTKSAVHMADEALVRQDVPSHEAVTVHLAASHFSGDGTAVDRAREILRAPDRHDKAVRVGAMTVVALDQWGSGHVGAAVDTLRDAVTLNHATGDAQILDPRWFLTLFLARIGEYEKAEAVVQGFARATTPVAEAALRARLHLATGQLDEAEAAAKTVVGPDDRQLSLLAPQAWLTLGHVALRRGVLSEAENCLRAVEENCWQLGTGPWQAACLWLRAQVVAAQEGPAAAVELLAGTGVLHWVVMEEPAAAPWLVRCALAAHREDIVRAVADAVESISTHSPHLPAVRATALHVRALVDRDVDAVAEAGRSHRNPWAQAAAAEDHADLLAARGDHETAVAELDRAMKAYSALGGERDATRVRARLRELGVLRRHWKHVKRPVSGWESLTETERKVAEVVASGLTNQQAARHLFVSPNTVGTHLRQVYRKLGIQSRAALIRLETSRVS
ncbi:LuxR C-terminal-related transcriptional regulator [Lentzea sp. NPDC051838]|uniref:helix-turn-helix transcriptional regulator n=1 Tax=Lentzea sp. NPDC051838 TaxID=3154849 RepID=UPI003449AFC1